MARKLVRVAIAVVVLLLARAILPDIGASIAEIPRGLSDRWVAHLNSRPPHRHTITSADRARYPRLGFGLILETSRGWRLDTFVGTATKDMIATPDTTVDLRLSEAQLDTLYDMVLAARCFEWTAPAAPAEDLPHPDTRLEVRAGATVQVLAWMGPSWGRTFGPMTDEWKHLRALESTIGRMVRAHPAYAALPAPTGIYID